MQMSRLIVAHWSQDQRPLQSAAMWQTGMWRIIGAILFAGIVGCTNANVPLNSLNVPPERERRNRTRSAVFAEVRELGPRTAMPTSQETEISLSPGSHARLPADHDGYFVGLCLSGGGSRSANFSAAC